MTIIANQPLSPVDIADVPDFDGKKIQKFTYGFGIPSYNLVNVTYPNAVSEVYTFKAGLATVGVITITYTDTTKDNLLSIERTI